MAEEKVTAEELALAKQAAVEYMLEQHYVPRFVEKCAEEGFAMTSQSEVAHAIGLNTKAQTLMSKGASMDELVDMLVERIGFAKKASDNNDPVTLSDINFAMDDLCKAAGFDIDNTPLEAKVANSMDPVTDEDIQSAQVLFAELPAE
jgi:hypothetical protein